MQNFDFRKAKQTVWLLLCVSLLIVSRPIFAQLENVQKFGYQLQNINISEIKNLDFDLIVLDYSADGSEETQFSFAQIDSIKKSGKQLIAYISIGEAETYRFYWHEKWDVDGDGRPDKGAPEWLDIENPEWEGNYKIHYWHPDWQAIIFKYLDRILAAGFDGVYLDIVDGYYYYQEQGRETAAAEMIDFVTAIANYTRATNTDFLVIPQNGAYIIWDVDDQTKYDQYLNVINGIGNEDVFFRGEKDENNSFNPDTDLINVLVEDYKENGKGVFIIDYVTQAEKKNRLFRECMKRGFVPYAAVRKLDQLPAFPSKE